MDEQRLCRKLLVLFQVLESEVLTEEDLSDLLPFVDGCAPVHQIRRCLQALWEGFFIHHKGFFIHHAGGEDLSKWCAASAMWADNPGEFAFWYVECWRRVCEHLRS